MSVSDDGDILLSPVVSIPARERIIWERPELMAAIDKGFADVAAGRTHYLGSFAHDADDDAAD